MIIPVTVLALAWFIVMNHVYVRRVRANKTEGFGHSFYKETTQFLYRFLVVGAAFSTLAVLLMGLNNDHTKLASLVRLQRGVDGTERGLRVVGLTPGTTFVLLIVVYLLLLAVRQEWMKRPGRLGVARSWADRILPALALFTFVVFFASRIGDASLDPTARIREIREGYTTYRAELRQELAAQAAAHGTEQLRAGSPDFRAIDGLRDSLWRARDAVLAAYAAAPVQAGQPIRVARVDTVRPTWTDAERHFIRRLDGVDALIRPAPTPDDEVPPSLSVQRIRDLREAVARERERRERQNQARAVVLGDAIKRIGTAAITMYLGDVSEAAIEAELRELLADFAQLDPTLPYIPRLFLDATESRLRARFADQLSFTIRRQADSDDPLGTTLDSAARRVAAELQSPSLDASIWVNLERRVRAAIADARSRARAIEAARRAALQPRVAVAPPPPVATASQQRVDTLWNELVGLWLADAGLGETFTVTVGDNEALRREAARLLGREADTLTLSPTVDALRSLSETYGQYVRGLGAEPAERELGELVQAAKAESTPARRVQIITTRALQRVPQALSTGLGIR
ncbi:MAG: hypothetical protein ABR499_19535 [Gemmatimonadaceae bacterium]